MPGDPGPLVRRRQVGSTLRRYRTDAGLSVREVAEALLCSAAKISRIETAQRPPTLRDVRDLCNLYKVSESVRAQLMKLAAESRETAWWQQFSLDPSLEKYVGLEGSATEISDYQNSVIPGLLQTREYATAILRAWIPDDSTALAETVEVRMRRQHLLGSRTSLHIVIDEGALRRSVGGTEVMRSQFKRLLELGDEPSLDMRIIPFSAGAHKGTTGGFTVLRFSENEPSHTEPGLSDVVYLESVSGGLYIDQPGEVARYVDIFRELRATALTKADAKRFLESIHSEVDSP